jgi:hypothetical protein
MLKGNMGDNDQQPYRLTNHAHEEAKRRNISLKMIDQILIAPNQVVDSQGGRKVYQSQVKIDDKLYLVRVVVEETNPLTVITVYRTSKIEKYWSNQE